MDENKVRCSSMTSHKWFGLSLQALVVLSSKPDICPSAKIAECLKSEATVLRRVLAKLAQANLIETREGRDGGYRLKQSPETITLADVYVALKVGEPLSNGMLDTIGMDHYGQEMKSAFIVIANEVEQKTIETLQQFTIAQLAENKVSAST